VNEFSAFEFKDRMLFDSHKICVSDTVFYTFISISYIYSILKGLRAVYRYHNIHDSNDDPS
jgi:hypothetical protein